MCGINGQFAYHVAASAVQRAEVERVRDAMALRGPDGAGYWQDANGRVALAHRRLAIIDLDDRAAQPMCSADQHLNVTFNGEIYNYLALRADLELLGAVFRTHSDTEVLLHGYRQWGLLPMVRRLRGMFAFALHDAQTNTLHLARDPYGIKPLYVADDGWTLRFASSVRALALSPGIDTSIDPAAQVGFYLWASVPEPHTWLRGIAALPAGHVQTVREIGPLPPVSYIDLAAHYELSPPEDLSLREALVDSVRAHLVADVPVGAFLSSGVDSGALVALMHEQGGQPIQTCTLRFAEFIGTPADEAPLAERIAQRYGTVHQTVTVSESDFLTSLPGLMAAMDQPSIDGFNTFLVSAATAQAGLKVALSGVGGDELFAGYDSFRAVPQWHRLRAVASLPLLSPALGLIARGFARAAGLPPKAPGFFSLARDWLGCYQLKRGLFMPWELSALLPSEVVRDGLRRLELSAALQPPWPRADLAKVSWLESTRYLRNQLLRDTDWASMAHSLEVRTPLVDSRLHQLLAVQIGQFANGNGKRLVANSPLQPLPDEIWQRPKTGFTTPVAGWLQRQSQFDGWRRHRFLAQPRQHWSRRFAVAIAAQFGG